MFHMLLQHQVAKNYAQEVQGEGGGDCHTVSGGDGGAGGRGVDRQSQVR